MFRIILLLLSFRMLNRDCPFLIRFMRRGKRHASLRCCCSQTHLICLYSFKLSYFLWPHRTCLINIVTQLTHYTCMHVGLKDCKECNVTKFIGGCHAFQVLLLQIKVNVVRCWIIKHFFLYFSISSCATFFFFFLVCSQQSTSFIG